MRLHLPLLRHKLESMNDANWNMLNRKVLGVIWLTLSKSVAHNVIKEKTTADLVGALLGMYKKSNENVIQHLNKFNTITNQLSPIEIEFDDEIKALILVALFPNS